MSKRSALGLHKLDEEETDTAPKQNSNVGRRKVEGLDDLLPRRNPAKSTTTTGGLVRKSIYFDTELLRHLEQVAHERSISLSEIVRTATRHMLDLNPELGHIPRGPSK